jgi:putative intracellular protease/amidase
MNRRELNTAGLAAAATALLSAGSSAAEATSPQNSKRPPGPLQIGLVMYPGFFAQDLIGPYTTLGLLPIAQVHLVAKSMDLVTATPAMSIKPTATYETCPRDLDVIMVPGATEATIAAMQDRALIEFLQDRGSRARYVTSVCTGSLILGAAGLLKGYKATSHWLAVDVLKDFGATYTPGRVVVDRNRITGGGVTAGIDFGLTLTAMLVGKSQAEMIQLVNEYNPEPPFQAGSPDRAPPEVTALVRKTFAASTERMKLAAAKIAAQPGF